MTSILRVTAAFQRQSISSSAATLLIWLGVVLLTSCMCYEHKITFAAPVTAAQWMYNNLLSPSFKTNSVTQQITQQLCTLQFTDMVDSHQIKITDVLCTSYKWLKVSTSHSPRAKVILPLIKKARCDSRVDSKQPQLSLLRPVDAD